MKSRWFNYRPLCIVFVFLLLGSVFVFYLSDYRILSIITTIIIFVFLLILTIIRKKIKYILIPLISFIVGAILYYSSVSSFQKEIEIPNSIQARIYNVNSIEDGRIKVYADSCIFDGVEINENLIIYVYDSSNLFENIEIGSVISFSPSNFYQTDLFYYGTPNASYYLKGLKYSATANASEINYLETDKTFAEKLKQYVKNNLRGSLTNENVEIAYSSLFGEIELLSDSQYNAYKLSGVAHLLAVSGMHVVIIVGILYKILDFLRIKNWPRIIIVSILLLFYMYICNFAVSIIRATIMSIVMLLAPKFFREYDILSSIALSGIIIYLINPLTAFDPGFLMSFACVIGIATLNKPIASALSHCKMPKWLIDSISISASTMISLIFIMAHFFNTLNAISLIANLILIPIFTFAFIAVFIVSIIGLILPFITIILYLINYVFDFINIVATILGNLPISNFSTVSFSYIAILLYAMLLLILSRVCVANRTTKVILSLPTVALLVVCLV